MLRLVAIVAIMVVPATARSDPEVAQVDAELAPGRMVHVAVRGVAGAHGTLAIAGRPPVEVPLTLPLPGGASSVSLRKVELSGGAVVHMRAADAGAALAEEAIVGLRGGRPEVVWSGVTGLRGDPTERMGKAVAFEDLTGDGLPEALLFDVSETVRLCGDPSPAALFPRAFDPASGSLRPVLLNRLRGSRAPETALAASSQSPGPTGRPLVAMASFTSASSTQGDGEDPIRLAPPLALGDGKLDTAWTEGRGGDGRGEFVTASLAGGYAVRAVGVVISSPGTPAEARRAGRPQNLTIVFEDRRFRVTIPDDPADRPGQTLWIALPGPVVSRCMSVVLGESRAGGPTRLAEISVYSDLDFGGGIDRLVADLSGPDAAAEDAARLLGGTGPAGAEALARALPRLQGRARFLAARVLADLHDPATLAVLEPLLGDPEERVRVQAVRAFVAVGEAAVPALGRVLDGDETTAGVSAASALGRIVSGGALDALIARAGRGGVEVRRAVRDAIGQSVALSPNGLAVLTNALLGSDPGDTGRRIELARALDPSRADERAVVVGAIEALSPIATELADRYHVLRLMGRLCEVQERRFAAELSRAAASPAASQEQEILRAEAISALGRCGPAGTGVLRDAIADRAPRVRAAAIDALTRAGDRGAAAKVARLARQDPWIFLRSAALESLPILAPEAAGAAVAAALGDRSAEVRRQGVRMAIRLGIRSAARDIAARAGDPNEEAEVRTDAVYALGVLCARRHVDVMKRLARMGLRPDATDLELAAAAAAIESLARIGGPVAEEELRAARRRSSPPALRIAAERARRLPRCEVR